MNTSPRSLLARTHRTLGVVAALAIAATIAFGFATPGAWRDAYRFALFATLAPAVGCLWFMLIFRTTGGQWGEALAPFLSAGGRLVPTLFLLALPLAWLAPQAAMGSFEYESRAMLVVRAIVGGLVVAAIAFVATKDRARRLAWIGPLGLIALVFTLHVLADDWLTTLEPGWHSTAFPLVWMTGQAVAGLACAILASLAGGLSPREPSDVSRPIGLDLGNLLLAALLVWSYVAFAQFLIIWSGNLPREISWYEHRSSSGWAGVPAALALLHFLLPLVLLLSRRLKRSRLALAIAAASLLAAQVLYTAWVTLGSLSASASGASAIALYAATATAALALFLNRYIKLAARSMALA